MRSIHRLSTMALSLFFMLATASRALAQTDSSSSTATQTTSTSQAAPMMWYSGWWMWAVGIAVFLLVVIAITNRGRSNRD